MASRRGVTVITGRALPYTPPPSAYICLKCRRLASDTATKASTVLPVSSSARHYASSSSLIERVRKRIWGTDNPPGPENPYGPPGAFEQKRLENELRDSEKGTAATDSLSRRQTAGNVREEDLQDLPEESEATTWEGMPVVGGPDWGQEEWDEEHPYEGYMVNPRPESREEIVSIVHRALVEVMTLKQANLPLEIDRFAIEPPNEYMQGIAEGAKFKVLGFNQVSLVIEQQELQQAIFEYIQPKQTMDEEEETQEQEPPIEEILNEESGKSTLQTTNHDGNFATTATSPEQAEIPKLVPEAEIVSEPPEDPPVYLPADDSWRQVSLADPDFKFAVLKRVMQLTGRRLADPDIGSIDDIRALLTHLVKKPKPKKLVETLFANDAVDLPNVDILERRYTPIDKEKEIGRWKVIERELKARGLPVTGKGLVAVGDPIA